jgi:hypothetical protein
MFSRLPDELILHIMLLLSERVDLLALAAADARLQRISRDRRLAATYAGSPRALFGASVLFSELQRRNAAWTQLGRSIFHDMLDDDWQVITDRVNEPVPVRFPIVLMANEYPVDPWRGQAFLRRLVQVPYSRSPGWYWRRGFLRGDDGVF